jgi:hypothetical protein
MLAVAAAIFFGVAFIRNGSGSGSHSAWFSAASLMYLGLACLAAHVARHWWP